jgi:hypothetical protein
MVFSFSILWFQKFGKIFQNFSNVFRIYTLKKIKINLSFQKTLWPQMKNLPPNKKNIDLQQYWGISEK